MPALRQRVRGRRVCEGLPIIPHRGAGGRLQMTPRNAPRGQAEHGCGSASGAGRKRLFSLAKSAKGSPVSTSGEVSIPDGGREESWTFAAIDTARRDRRISSTA